MQRFFRHHWPSLLGVAAVVGLFAFTLQFVEPPPPKNLSIASGQPGGGYAHFAEKYAAALRQKGLTVTVVPTNGSLENLQRLQDGSVDVGFVQGGMAGKLPSPNDVCGLGYIYFEPLWVFYPKDKPFRSLRDLQGKRLSIGMIGSGTHALSTELLAWNGVTPENSTFREKSVNDEITALRTSQLDALFFVGSPESDVLRELTSMPGVSIHSFADSYTYVRNFSFLAGVRIPAGIFDMAQNRPPTDVVLLAPTAMLASRNTLHSSLVILLLRTAEELHGGHGLLYDAKMFPHIHAMELSIHPNADRYFKSGPPFLQRYLPYQIASYLDRTKIMFLPLLTLVPLIRLAPVTYSWSIRRRIWRWYRNLFELEADLRRDTCSTEELIHRLNELEGRVLRQEVPPAFAAELYTLRFHLTLTREQLEKKITKDKL
jgi:TRAP transporter TAXI family solute receptor